MGFFGEVVPEQADGKVQQVYEALDKELGFIPEFNRTISPNADLLYAQTNLFKTIMYGELSLSRKLRELMTTFVSKLNECEY